MKHAVLKSILGVLIAGSLASGALAGMVTYNLTATDGFNNFTGSFSFDTSTDTISNAILQSSGGFVDNWVATTLPYPYYGVTDSEPSGTWDLFFSSASANFPASPGDIVGIEFVNPLDGVSADSIWGLDYFTYDYPPDPEPFIADGYIQGCVTPGPACGLAATPVPSTWLLLLGGLVGLGFFACRGTKKNLAAVATA
jgi:hypothetical protein